MPARLAQFFFGRRAAEGAEAVVLLGDLGLPSALDAGIAVALIDGETDLLKLALADLRSVLAGRRP